MIISVNLDSSFILELKKYNIFQTRTGMMRTYQEPITRWKVGDQISFLKSTAIEEFTTFACGNCLFSCGSFSAFASDFRVNTKVGRYCECAHGCNRMAFRHPLEAVCMNSAVFNFFRENVYSYFDCYEGRNHLKLVKNSVPTPQPQETGYIEIGHDVWIGSNVTVSGGVSIGTGSVIASGSIVTKDVVPYSVVAGCPAELKKFRFSPDIVHGLMESKWWNYELGDMFRENLDFSNPENFLNKFFVVKNNIRLLDVRTFYPYKYIATKHVHKSNCLCTHFYTVAVFDFQRCYLLHKEFSATENLCLVETFIENNKVFFRVGDKYIQNIDNFGKCIIGKDKVLFDIVCNGIVVSVCCFSKYLSARIGGTFSFVDKLDGWEEFVIS